MLEVLINFLDRIYRINWIFFDFPDESQKFQLPSANKHNLNSNDIG